MKIISVLGSTGSIGTQTLDVVRKNSDLKIISMAAGANIELFEKQIREFKPKIVALWSKENADILKERLKDMDIEVFHGMEGLIKVSTVEESEILVTAIVGMIGLRPTLKAIEAGKNIALANKETLVTAGHLIMPLAREKGVDIIPVDSEHSAILHCLRGESLKEVKSVILTASGGPFRGKKRADLLDITPEKALKHPNWSMGRKISIDSATLVNKGLEVIEAKWLFDLTPNQIQVVVQPQSIIHSMVEFLDHSIAAQLGNPDMRLAIQYAICYPEHRFLDSKPLDFGELGQITFEKPDIETFKGLALAFKAMEMGGSATTVYNSANELAVDLFLSEKISFLEITDIIEECLNNIEIIDNPSLEQILETEKITHDYIKRKL